MSPQLRRPFCTLRAAPWRSGASQTPSSKGFTPPRGQKKRSPDPTRVGDIVRRLMQEQVFAVGGQLGRLSTAWATVVDERLAQDTAPKGLERGVLTIETSSDAWGTQVGFLSKEITKRANEVLGESAVKDVRVVVARSGRNSLQRNE